MRIYRYAECLSALEKARPLIGNYDFFFKLMRARTAQTGIFPRQVYRICKKLVNKNRPFFIGQAPSGEKFLGKFTDYLSAQIAVVPHYDEGLLSALKSAVIPGKAYLDIGANLGLTSAVIAKYSPQSTVYAFEPVPETFLRAAGTIALNDLKNVVVIDIALGKENSTVPMYFSPEVTSSASVGSFIQEQVSGNAEIIGATKDKQQKVEVELWRLDDVQQKLGIGPVGFMKIDVEGFEYNVVQGAVRAIADNKPIIMYEYNAIMAPQAGWSVQSMSDLLATATNYHHQFVDDDGKTTNEILSEKQVVSNILCLPK